VQRWLACRRGRELVYFAVANGSARLPNWGNDFTEVLVANPLRLMEEAERYVRTWVAAPRDKEIEDTVSGMGSRITVILRSF
jgi:hypothetical protein